VEAVFSFLLELPQSKLDRFFWLIEHSWNRYASISTHDPELLPLFLSIALEKALSCEPLAVAVGLVP